MTKFKSEIIPIDASTGEIYHFLNDFSNFGKLMPEQVINWQNAGDHCSFSIKGMADIAMRIDEREEDKRIVYRSEGKTPFDFHLQFKLDDTGDNKSRVEAELEAKLNPMLKMMASRPLQNLVNILTEQLKSEMESSS